VCSDPSTIEYARTGGQTAMQEIRHLPSNAVFCRSRTGGLESFEKARDSEVHKKSAMRDPSEGPRPAEKASHVRLDSWKAIAAYLKRDVTTVQRWEKREGMPVHRHVHDKRGSVYALSSELDAWLQSRTLLLEEESKRPTPAPEGDGAPTVEASAQDGGADDSWTPAWRRRRSLLLGLLAIVLLLGGGYVWQQRRIESVVPPEIRSLAVLPLKNLSGDPSQEYLADGITEALIGGLAQIRNLRVVSHTSVMRFKNPQMSIPEIAKTLRADALLEGSVMREGGRIRVTAQLIHGTTDEHFWSVTYDRELSDVLALESELAQSIARKVEVTITGEEERRLRAARSVAPEVYESYLKGQFAYNQGNSLARMQESLGYFADAVNRDPTFAPAYLGLAKAYTALGTVFIGGLAEEARPRVLNAARKALELDPNLAEAHVLVANVLQEQWHWAEAEAEYRRALELSPNDPDAHAQFAVWLVCQGRTDEAVAWTRRGRELDPIVVPAASLGWILFQSHRSEEALKELRGEVALAPARARALWTLGFALIAADQAARAVPVLEETLSLTNDSPAAAGVLIRAYAHAGRRDDGVRLVRRLEERRKTEYVPAGAFVNAYLGLDEPEQAFAWLEQAFKEQSNILQYLKVHPYFDPIRSDPRFADLLHRVGLDTDR